MLPKVLDKPSVIAGGAGSELAGQLIESKGDVTELDGTKIGISTVVGVTTKNMRAIGVGITNAGVEYLDAYRTGKNPIYEAAASGVLSGGTAAIGGKVTKLADYKFNPKSNEYTFDRLSPESYIYQQRMQNYSSTIIGNSIDNITNKFSKFKLDDAYYGEDDEK